MVRRVSSLVRLCLYVGLYNALMTVFICFAQATTSRSRNDLGLQTPARLLTPLILHMHGAREYFP